MRSCHIVPILHSIAACQAALASPVPLPQFSVGAAMQRTSQFDCDGACERYKPCATCPAEDPFKTLQKHGFNLARLRLWVHPDKDLSYGNLTGVLDIARRASAAGQATWLDIEYSDTWTDPGHQSKPAAWSQLAPDSLADAVSQFTNHALQALTAQGTPPSMVQVGNEINVGMLWAPKGQPCSKGGYLGSVCGPDRNLPAFARLVAAGIRAVRTTTPGAVVMLHTSLGSNLAKPGGADYAAEWYKNVSTALGAMDPPVLFDMVGLSFYPHWGAGNTSNVLLASKILEALPDRIGLFVAETAYPYAGQTAPGAQFPYTRQGQLDYARAIVRDTQRLGARARGVSWWGTEWVNGSGAGLTGLWDTEWTATPALLQGFSGKDFIRLD